MWAKGNRAAERGAAAGRFPPDVPAQEEEFMQRTLLTLALITAAGTAFAQTATPPAANGGSLTTPSVTAPSASTLSVPSQTMGAGGATVTAPGVGGATVNPPSASAGGATPPGVNRPSMTQDTNTANASPRLSGQAGIAQKRIEADGYKNVQGLAQGSDGLWHGHAMRGSAEVQVIVDKQGNVAQQ
jgi:hypothetical protein